MITVHTDSNSALVQERDLSALVIAAALFLLLGLLTTLQPARSAVHWAGTASLWAAALACFVFGRGRRTLCRISTAPQDAPREPIQVHWSRLDDSRISVHLGDRPDELFGGTRVSSVLSAAEELAETLRLPLRVRGQTLNCSFVRAQRPSRAHRALPASGALRRAELACWVVGALLAVQMTAIAVGTGGRLESIHPLSIALAILTPASVLLVALALRVRQPYVRLGSVIEVEYRLAGRCFRRLRFDHEPVLCTLLQHPRLDLGFLWIRSGPQSVILSSNAEAAAEVAAAISRSVKPTEETAL